MGRPSFEESGVVQDAPFDAEKHIIKDEARVASIIEGSVNGDPIDPILDKRISRKFDMHIIPWLWLFWLWSFIDRANIGNARIAGLAKQLDLVGLKFNIALAVFYIPYILIDVPIVWFIKRIGAGYYLPAWIIGWGFVSAMGGLTKSYGGLIAYRFFLGFMEAPILGGLIIYVSLFYRRHELMYRIGLWYTGAPLSGAFGGLLATGLETINYHGYNSWPWIFIIEGCITVTIGALAMIFLPHTPATSKFLTAEERAGAIARLHLDSHGSDQGRAVDDQKFSWPQVKKAILNINTLLMTANFFCVIIAIYSYSLFLPTIINELGYKKVQAQLFTVPPNFCAFICVLIFCTLSDRIKMRSPIIFGGALCAIVGYIILLSGKRPAVKYGGSFFVACGMFLCPPNLFGWLSNNSAPHYVNATATGFQIAMAQFSSFIAVFIYLTRDAPNFHIGHSTVIGALTLSMILTTLNVIHIKRENKKRDEGKRDYRYDEGPEEDLGSEHPKFRYTL